uniref:Uncharacterized protein n=1 Tax=Timema genevievae TaxID=629358 RepID=A0A7R9PLU8_TIMGE|nr:unnamed protein product [Timema genevievae]
MMPVANAELTRRVERIPTLANMLRHQYLGHTRSALSVMWKMEVRLYQVMLMVVMARTAMYAGGYKQPFPRPLPFPGSYLRNLRDTIKQNSLTLLLKVMYKYETRKPLEHERSSYGGELYDRQGGRNVLTSSDCT